MENNNINANTDIKKKDATKGKIILFVIGVLVGAVISTAAFFVYVKTLGANNSSSSSQQAQGGAQSEMPSSGNAQNNETPPEKPDDDNTQDGETPPEKPDNED